MNGYEFSLTVINCGVPQGFALGPKSSNKICKVHHFPDDTNLFCHSNSMKKLNK